MMTTKVKIKLKVPTPLTAGGKVQKAGSEHEVSGKKAQYLVTNGKAVPVEKPATGSK